MNKHIRAMAPSALLVLLWAAAPTLAQNSASSNPGESKPVVVETVINREAPKFNPAVTVLVAGRDGRVYLSCGGGGSGYFLSMKPDGSDKRGYPLGHAEELSAVNDKGVRAHRLGHFAHTANFYAADGTLLGANTDFDNANFDAPFVIAAGSSDFYALDRFAKRIVRLDTAGRPQKIYPISDINYIDMRVCEPKNLMVIHHGSQGAAIVDFDGKLLRSFGSPGPYNFHDDGLLYMLPYRDSNVMTIQDVMGKPMGEVKLDLGDRMATGAMYFTHLVHLGDEVLLKRNHPFELFARYDRKTGQFKGAVSSDHDLLRLTLGSDILTAGKPMAMKLEYESGTRQSKPLWHVWARPFGAPGWRELTWKNDQLQVPADYAGLYQLKVSDETTPLPRGNNSETLIETIVEVRAANSRGNVSVLTPENRVYYGRGEVISAGFIVRTSAADAPRQLQLQLREGGAETAPGRVVHEQMVAAPAPTADSADAAAPIAAPTYPFTLPSTLTRSLKPGPYILTVSAPKLTCVGQTLVIGPGDSSGKFWKILHGDMGNFSIGDGTPQRTPDTVAAWKDSLERLGFNAIVERLGSMHHRGWFVPDQFAAQTAELRVRLAKDPQAVAPQRLVQPLPVLQCAGAYSALGVALMPILLGNDAGVPLGQGHDNRSNDDLTADVARVTKALDPYSSFYGWSWAANWWMFFPWMHLSDADKTAFDAAWKNANESGTWDPILDKGFDALLAQNDESIERVTKMFQQAATRDRTSYKTAVASPYRRVQWHSPTNFAGVDEVDLHYQCEQVPAPFYMLHEVDWYRRPGKRAWGHIECYNESGTGEQILGASLMMLMRAPDGIGVQSGMPVMFLDPLNTADSRVSARGGASVLRSLNRLAEQFGPLLAAAENADPVAIVVSSRMNRSDQWGGSWTGLHFGRLANAYMACLANHTPASFVYTEDLPTKPLNRYKAVLVVDQRYQMEPGLDAALKEAQAAGVRVFADGTCRAELVREFTSLGVEFKQFDDGFGANHHDLAYRLMPKRIAATAEALKQHLGSVRNLHPNCDNPEVYISTRRSGKTTYVIVVNNTMIPLEFGRMWRATLFSSTRMPVVADVVLPQELAQKPAYDLMSGQKLDASQGRVRLDLRNLPMRIIALIDEAPRTVGEPIERRFGPHLRDAAVSADGSTVLFNAMNWDDNVYALNTADGKPRFQGKVGGYFAFAPLGTANGFYVQGFDFEATEGYHLYQLGADGSLQRRFGLYGIANRLPFRFVPHLLRDRINNFTAAPDGAWIASSGDLGVAVWDSQGQLLWKADEWKDGKRQPYLLAALDANTLLTASGMTLQAFPVRAKSDKAPAPLWEQTLATTGEIRAVQASRDGKVIAAMTSLNGGAVTILREGRIEQTFPCSIVNLCALSADGARLAIVQYSRLTVIALADGTQWAVHGEGPLHMPRFSPDGQRLAVSSDHGILSILRASDGTPLHTRDLQALAVPAWLANGDLIVGDWMGHVARLGADYKNVWQVQLAPVNTNVAATLKVAASLPTVSIAEWSNALPKPLVTADQLTKTPNLLRKEPNQIWAFYTHFVSGGRDAPVVRGAQTLFDGLTAPVEATGPTSDLTDPDAFYPWNTIEGFAENPGENWIEMDAGNVSVRLEGLTFFENADRPESWLRDLKLEMWDFDKNRWITVCPLLSNAAVHSHKLPQPVEGTRFRLLLPPYCPGNIRLSELVVHGKALGWSHPDVRAKKPVAVLFDDNVSELARAYEQGAHFKLETGKEAYSGASFIRFTPTPGRASADPFMVVPNWAFDINKTPKPGAYRYLQFACKALSKETTKITLFAHGAKAIVVENPKEDWQVVRVDLWSLMNGQPITINQISFSSEGGPAAFDQILVGRALKDLKAYRAPGEKPEEKPAEKKAEAKKPETKRPETKKSEAKKPETKKAEAKKPE